MDAKKKLIVGLFVAGALSFFALGLFLIGDSTQLFTRSFSVDADFAKVTGLEIGTKVRVAGMDGGAVTSIQIPPNPAAKFHVRFRIVEKLHSLVRQDSIATIQTDGLLGNKFLEVDAGSQASPPARNESSIRSKEPFDFAELMDQMSDTVKAVTAAIPGIKSEVAEVLTHINNVVESANRLVKTATPDVKSILASSSKIAADIREITAGIQAGEGTVGALFKDKALSASVKRSATDAGTAIQNIRDTTASAKRIVGKVDNSDIVPELQRTLKNVEQITLHVKEAVDKFQAASGEGGVSENLQRTLADAHEAMSDLSEDTEALKHNFLFRGFFNKRGFFDLGSLSAPDYKAGKLGKGFQQLAIAFPGSDLFTADAKGVETISAGGKKLLDEAMTEIMQYPRNGPLMVEGYAGAGTAPQQYLQSRHRAVLVQSQITYRFHLRPAYVGIVAMGSGLVDGVRLVSFFKK